MSKRVSVEIARVIMGSNFLDISSVCDFPILKYWSRDWAAKSTLGVPFTTDQLHACRESHVLLLMWPLSIVELKEIIGPQWFYQGWYRASVSAFAFARERGDMEWHLVSKVGLSESDNRTWEDQISLLKGDEMVPSAVTLICTMIAHHLVTGQYLFQDCAARTSSVVETEPDDHICVGIHDEGGLDIRYIWDLDPSSEDLVLAVEKCPFL